MTESRSTLPGAWLVVGLLWVVGFFNYLVRIMLTTMHGSMVAAIPMSEADFGLLTSVFLWVYGGLSPFAGYLADRFSRSRVIVISLIAWCGITWLTGFAHNFGELLAMRALLGLSEAFFLPASLALITDYHRGPTRSFAVGLNATGVMFGAAMGGLGGWLAERHSWHFAFSLIGGVGVAYGLALALVLRDAPREGRADRRAAERPRFGAACASLFSNGSFILLVVFWGLLGITGGAVTGWMPTYVMEHFKLHQGTAGFSSTGFSNIPGIIGLLLGGFWADCWSRTHPRARILVPAIGLAVAAPGLILVSHTGVLAAAMLGLLVYGMAVAFSSSNLMPILCLVSDPRYRATGYGVLNATATLIGGVAVFAGGALRDANIEVSRVFDLGTVMLLVCAALLLLVRPASPSS